MKTNGHYPHRVAVTGIGLITPIAIGVDAFWDATVSGKRGVRSITRFDPTEFGSRNAAQIDDFDPHDYLEAKRVRRTDRFAQFSIAASRLALDDAGLRIVDGDEVGVWIGSALGGLAYAEEQHSRFTMEGARAVHPLLAIAVFGGSATTNVAIEFGIRGPNVANANSCAAGAVALGDAFRAVARGEVRAALAGGVEAPLSPLVFGAFALIKSMSKRNDDPPGASRPFDRDRDGFVMAEGAGIFVLERYEDAVRRDARIYGEIAGFGLTGDAHHMTAPRPDGASAARAMTKALAEAAVSADEVELIDAHGSSSPLNDVTEALAFTRVFGERAKKIPIAATKGQHGHALGATGVWEAALSLLAMRERTVPGLVNLEHADAACALNLAQSSRVASSSIALSNSSGFGGINAALVLRGAAG
jgi:3-oxoacyl-[acyl-carrier-protein] synthase II